MWLRLTERRPLELRLAAECRFGAPEPLRPTAGAFEAPVPARFGVRLLVGVDDRPGVVLLGVVALGVLVGLVLRLFVDPERA